MTSVTPPYKDPTTVAAAIEKLIMEGVRDNKELMDKSGANSLAYVRKRKYIVMKKHKLNPTTREMQKQTLERGSKRFQDQSLQPLSPLTPEERKKLWQDFIKGTPLPNIIAEHGFLPQLVNVEFYYFQQMRGISLSAVQGLVFEEIAKSQDILTQGHLKPRLERYTALVSKYRSDKQLGLPEFEELITILEEIYNERGRLWVDDLDENPIEGWARPICITCKDQILGLVYKKDMFWENHSPTRITDRFYHYQCSRS